MTEHRLLKIQGLWKTYADDQRNRPVLQDLSLTLDAGSTLALTGESGSGKSTLLNIIGTLENYDQGNVTLDGMPYSNLTENQKADIRRSTLSIVFQGFNLIPSLNVAQNISLQARLAGQFDQTWTDHITDRLGLGDMDHRFPAELSGGQQQRVAIARAMAVRPRLLLADEPTGNLDETASRQVLDLFLDLVQDTGTTMILVTHSDKIAQRLQHRRHLSQGQLQ